MAIQAPLLDPRNEDEVVASVIDDLPDTLSDRNRSSLAVELVEACGTFYGKLTYFLNQWPQAVEYKVLQLLGVTPEPSTYALVELTFTSAADAVGAITVPAGTIIKTGTTDDAIEVMTILDVDVPGAGGSATVDAQAVEPGAAGNIAPNRATFFDQPIASIASVTNVQSGSGGQDEETLAAMKERSAKETRSQNRVVTTEDAEQQAEGVAGVLRARGAGSIYFDGFNTFTRATGVNVIAIVDTTINETQNTPLQEAVAEAINAQAMAGYITSVHQPKVRLIYVRAVEAVLDGTKTAADVQASMLAAMAQYFTAIDVYDTDGVTLLQSGWKWGSKMYAYEVITLLDRVPGVERIVSVNFDYSDDYGTAWTEDVALVDLEPGPIGEVTNMWGLFHWKTRDSVPFTLIQP